MDNSGIIRSFCGRDYIFLYASKSPYFCLGLYAIIVKVVTAKPKLGYYRFLSVFLRCAIFEWRKITLQLQFRIYTARHYPKLKTS